LIVVKNYFQRKGCPIVIIQSADRQALHSPGLGPSLARLFDDAMTMQLQSLDEAWAQHEKAIARLCWQLLCQEQFKWIPNSKKALPPASR
jgi:hypothetical protein